MSKLQFRYATKEDVALVLHFIQEIAEYEKMLDKVIATEESLYEWIFEKKVANVIFACIDGKEIGFALFFYNFSTFVGKAGLYLEDLYIYEEYRGSGYGKEIFLKLIEIAIENNCGRMEWVCLDWNTPSINFYRSLGAQSMDEWSTYRLDEQTLHKLHSM